MGFLSSIFGGGKKSADLSDPQYQHYLASKIASLFDGFIVQMGAASFLNGATAVVLSHEGDVSISQVGKEKLPCTQPRGYTKLSELGSFQAVRDEMTSDPESSMLTMMMDNLAREALSHLLRQAR